MTFDQLRQFCLSLPGTTEGIKWEEHLCFMVAEKIFLIVNIDPPHGFALKINPEDFDALTEREGISQASHMAKRQWIGVAHLQVMTDTELKKHIVLSRDLVIDKLSQKQQAKYR